MWQLGGLNKDILPKFLKAFESHRSQGEFNGLRIQTQHSDMQPEKFSWKRGRESQFRKRLTTIVLTVLQGQRTSYPLIFLKTKKNFIMYTLKLLLAGHANWKCTGYPLLHPRAAGSHSKLAGKSSEARSLHQFWGRGHKESAITASKVEYEHSQPPDPPTFSICHTYSYYSASSLAHQQSKNLIPV